MAVAMKSYLKLYGPRIDDALDALQELASSFPEVTKGEPTRAMIRKGEAIMGDYDFYFEWATEPTPEKVRLLIFRIDEALEDTGCKYTISTK